MWHGLLFYCVIGRIALALKYKTITHKCDCLNDYISTSLISRLKQLSLISQTVTLWSFISFYFLHKTIICTLHWSKIPADSNAFRRCLSPDLNTCPIFNGFKMNVFTSKVMILCPVDVWDFYNFSTKTH